MRLSVGFAVALLTNRDNVRDIISGSHRIRHREEVVSANHRSFSAYPAEFALVLGLNVDLEQLVGFKADFLLTYLFHFSHFRFSLSSPPILSGKSKTRP